MDEHATEEALPAEILDLERRLKDAKARLSRPSAPTVLTGSGPKNDLFRSVIHLFPATHSLLLLSDSALPLGSFAYSSGLESYIAHHKPLPKDVTPLASFHRFLDLSIASVAGTMIPYLLSAHRNPGGLERLDNDLDASTLCAVARRASIAQGLALLGVWERSFRTRNSPTDNSPEASSLKVFGNALKRGPDDEYPVNGHFAPLWAVVTRSMGLDASHSAYVFLVNHAKGILSAAVRASVMGPYQAQTVLGSRQLQVLVTDCLEAEWSTKPEDAGQVAPALDLWLGRHELLYSRIFNS